MSSRAGRLASQFMGICAVLIGIAVFAEAGAIADTDGDLIPDVFDNGGYGAWGPTDRG
jgi:hypothetical protein